MRLDAFSETYYKEDDRVNRKSEDLEINRSG